SVSHSDGNRQSVAELHGRWLPATAASQSTQPDVAATQSVVRNRPAAGTAAPRHRGADVVRQPVWNLVTRTGQRNIPGITPGMRNRPSMICAVDFGSPLTTNSPS